jgi:hypothetical protein
MGILAKLLRRPDPYLDAAKGLVPMAQLVATSIFVPLLRDYPTLHHVDLDDWDFFTTVAGVQLALVRLQETAGDKTYRRVFPAVASALASWNPAAPGALEDCYDFVGHAAEAPTPNREGSESARAEETGIWVLWNLYRRPPTLEEARPARAIGDLLARPFHAWWH